MGTVHGSTPEMASSHLFGGGRNCLVGIHSWAKAHRTFMRKCAEHQRWPLSHMRSRCWAPHCWFPNGRMSQGWNSVTQASTSSLQCSWQVVRRERQIQSSTSGVANLLLKGDAMLLLCCAQQDCKALPHLPGFCWHPTSTFPT